MSWNISNDRPVYIQLVEELTMRIVSGVYKPGERIDSVREFAQQAKVNPNTMQKALAEIERNGLVYSQRTAGKFVTNDKDVIEKARRSIASSQVESFMSAMYKLGFEKKTVIELISEAKENDNE